MRREGVIEDPGKESIFTLLVRIIARGSGSALAPHGKTLEVPMAAAPAATAKKAH